MEQVSFKFQALRENRLSSHFTNFMNGLTMGQAVSIRLLTAEAWVHARVNPCGICGGQSGTGIGYSTKYPGLPCRYHSTVAPHIYRMGDEQ
jgi:hypothetical protein